MPCETFCIGCRLLASTGTRPRTTTRSSCCRDPVHLENLPAKFPSHVLGDAPCAKRTKLSLSQPEKSIYIGVALDSPRQLTWFDAEEIRFHHPAGRVVSAAGRTGARRGR